jgi:uncharacterized membrane protein
MVIIDYIWLGIIQKNYFTVMAKKINCGDTNHVNCISIIITYLVMAFSIYYFVFYIGETEISLATVLLRASLLSLCIYLVFDFTMMNLVNAWGWKDAIKDIIWGNILYIIVAATTYYLV